MNAINPLRGASGNGNSGSYAEYAHGDVPTDLLIVDDQMSDAAEPEWVSDGDIWPEPDSVDRFPATLTHGRQALLNSRGEPDGAVRRVWLSSRVDAKDALRVVGPKDGRPLYINVGSGFHKLEVESGNVVISAGSTWGNPVTAQGNSNVVVTAGAGCKVSVTAQDDARLIADYSAEGCRGFASAQDEGQVEVYVHEDYDAQDRRTDRASVGLSSRVKEILPREDQDPFTIGIRKELLDAGSKRLLDDGSSW